MAPLSNSTSQYGASRANPFRRAVIGGLGILLPPLLTIVILVWVGNTVADYLLVPLESAAREIIYRSTADILSPAAAESGSEHPDYRGNPDYLVLDDKIYHRTADDRYVPEDVYQTVQQAIDSDPMPPTARSVYERYIDETYLQRHVVVPIFLLLFILVLYLLGKFMAAGVGVFFWSQFEGIITHLPLIRSVYSSVKQVTDFLFTAQNMEYTRVVAIEYPRKGIWSLAMVTGEALLDVRAAANEPVLSLLVPTSPMPFTGFTVIAKKSEIVDLNITMDQAIQYIVSCGVVVPPEQWASLADRKETESIDGMPRLTENLAGQRRRPTTGETMMPAPGSEPSLERDLNR
jgi:uncharacterized membrane protein